MKTFLIKDIASAFTKMSEIRETTRRRCVCLGGGGGNKGHMVWRHTAWHACINGSDNNAFHFVCSLAFVLCHHWFIQAGVSHPSLPSSVQSASTQRLPPTEAFTCQFYISVMNISEKSRCYVQFLLRQAHFTHQLSTVMASFRSCVHMNLSVISNHKSHLKV